MSNHSSTYFPDLFLSRIDTTNRLYYTPEEAYNIADSTALTLQVPVLKEEKISDRPKSLDTVFVLFLICFIISSQILSKSGKMLSSMFSGLFRQKERKSIFFEATGNELYSKLLLYLQTSIILSIFTYICFSHDSQEQAMSLTKVLLIIGGNCLLFILFFLYKWLSYSAIGKIFFNKETIAQWLNNFLSLICILGIILFIPVLLMFYVDSIYSFCYFFILFCFFITAIILIYKTYVLFFHNISLLLYLFLYLCTQEIVPLLILYKGLVYLFNIVVKDTLWL